MTIDRPFGHSGQLLDRLLRRTTSEVDGEGDNGKRRREGECEPGGYGLAKEDRRGKEEEREECSDYRNMV